MGEGEELYSLTGPDWPYNGLNITNVANIQLVQLTRVSLIMRTQSHCSEMSLLIFGAAM
jgi:hypothetical protein